MFKRFVITGWLLALSAAADAQNIFVARQTSSSGPSLTTAVAPGGGKTWSKVDIQKVADVNRTPPAVTAAFSIRHDKFNCQYDGRAVANQRIYFNVNCKNSSFAAGL